MGEKAISFTNLVEKMCDLRHICQNISELKEASRSPVLPNKVDFVFASMMTVEFIPSKLDESCQIGG